ncbi:type VI secretion system lipoprotein TssJ [Aliivibrio salmonicida]|uniref:type VI secretion system lipoprotein TssJ n=1 Tax=Aliivibrio salmonicida TaxID=40269 RepID=UPI00406CB32D
MLRRLCLICIVLILSGCGLFREELIEPKLVVHIKSSTNINPNVEDKPSPVELRIYQLTNNNAFEHSDFIKIYNDDQGVLKAELVVSRQLPSILPGETRQEIIPLGTGVQYIGVIAGFADYREAKNKVIYKPLIVTSTIISIEIDGINLFVSGEEK